MWCVPNEHTRAFCVGMALTGPPAESHDIRQAHADVKDLTLQYNTLCDECDALDVAKATLEADVLVLAQRQAELQSDLRTVENSIPVASQALLDTKYNTLCDECDALDVTKATLEADVLELAQRQAVLQSDLRTAENSIPVASQALLDTKYNTLCDECDALDVTKATLQADVQVLVQRQAVLQSDLQTVENSIPVATQALLDIKKQHEQEMTQASGRLQDILYTIDTRTAQSQALQVRHEQLCVDVTSCTEQHSEILKGIGESHVVLDDIRAQHSAAVDHLQSLRQQHNEQERSSRAEHEAIHSAQQRMRDVLTELEQSVAHLKEQKLDAQHELEALRGTEHAHRESTCSLVNQQLAEGEAELVLVLAQNEAAQGQLSMLCGTHDEKQLALIQLGLACEERQRQSTEAQDRAQQDLDEAHASLAQCVRSISGRNDELVRIEEQIGRRSAFFAGITAETCQHQASIQQLAASVAEKETELIRLQGELQNTLVHIDNKQAEATALQVHGASVHAELGSTQQQLRDCREELVLFQHDLSECVAEVDAMQECAAEKKASAHALQAQQHAEYQAEVAQQVAELDALERDLLQTKDSLHAAHVAVQASEKHAELQQEQCATVAQKHAEGVAELQTIHDDIVRSTAELRLLRSELDDSHAVTGSTTGISHALQETIRQNADDDEFEAMLMLLPDVEVAPPHNTQHADATRAGDHAPNTADARTAAIVLQQHTLCVENSRVAADLQTMCAELARDQCAGAHEQQSATDRHDLRKETVRQHVAELALEEHRLQTEVQQLQMAASKERTEEDERRARNLALSAVLLQVQADIVRHELASVALVDGMEQQQHALRDAVDAALGSRQQHTATCEELRDLQSQIGAARDELVDKNANLTILQQHTALLVAEKNKLQEESLEMSTALQDVRTAICQHEHTSEGLSHAIEEQRAALHDAANAVSVSRQENTTTCHEILTMQQKTDALHKKHSKSQRALAKVQQQTLEANEAHATILARIDHDSAAVLCTQSDLELSLQQLEAAQVDCEAETTRHLLQQAQQLAQCDEMQASVDGMIHNKQRIVESIEVLLRSKAEYEQKLHSIQLYSRSLNTGMDQLRASMHMHTHSAEFHVSTNAILDLFGNFLDWFESTFTTRLYDFSCLLLNSRVE